MFAHRATSKHIQQMIVAGRTVAQNAALLGIDLDGVQAELNAQVRAGASEYLSWQQASAGLRQRVAAFYGAGLHRCG